MPLDKTGELVGNIIVPLLVALLSAGGTGVLFYLFEWKPRRELAKANARHKNAEAQKLEADAVETRARADGLIQDTVNDLLQPMRDEIARLQKDKNELRAEVDRLSSEVAGFKRTVNNLWRYVGHLLEVIRKLSQQIRELGAEPCIQPDEWNPET